MRAVLPAMPRALAAAVVVTLAAGHALAADDLVAKGEYLTRAGDCEACHTAPGGQPFAGGRGIDTPFGAIYSANITPDRDTGIGSWTDDQFYRAMHEGVADDGTLLYPAFPYQWYTKVTREDVQAIKAYLFSLAPVHAEKPENGLTFPFNIRAGLAAWNALFFHPGTFAPDPAASAEVNRGAYLVEGLGHCGACHTPKNLAQAPKSGQAFAGEPIQNWYAPNISSDVREGIGGWSDDALVQFLKTGAAPGRGVVLGPMAETIQHSLAFMTDADLHAMVAYLKAQPPQTSFKPAVPEGGPAVAGAQTYLSYCASCHQLDGRGLAGVVPALAGDGAVTAKGPENVIRVVLGGLFASGDNALMPAVGTEMTDDEVAEVTNYVRSAWGNAAPATVGPGTVGDIRKQTRTWLAAPGAGGCGADPSPAPSVTKAIEDHATGIAAALQGVPAAANLARIAPIAAKAHQAAPDASRADLVNGLTYAFCPVAGQAGDPAQRRRLINRFAELVYTALASPAR